MAMLTKKEIRVNAIEIMNQKENRVSSQGSNTIDNLADRVYL
jgi:hypothetical protein